MNNYKKFNSVPSYMMTVKFIHISMNTDIINNISFFLKIFYLEKFLLLQNEKITCSWKN